MSKVSFNPNWDRLNHEWSGGITSEGYAICSNCKCGDNSDVAAEVCWDGPAVKWLRKHIKAELTNYRATVPEWMKNIFEGLQ